MEVFSIMRALQQALQKHKDDRKSETNIKKRQDIKQTTNDITVI
jgi:hypothetical protein